METLADVNARYGDELAEASSYSTDTVRFLGGRNSPIVVATLLISLGWTLLVIQTESFRFDRPGDTPDRPFFEILVPTPSAATMAFLGAYFFGTTCCCAAISRVTCAQRSTTRSRLGLITVVVLAYLIQTLFLDSDDAEPCDLGDVVHGRRRADDNAPAGQPPRRSTGLGKLKRKQSNEATGALGEIFAVRRKLTQLDGIDIHDSTRLESEGITDIPALASADLVSLMINTRLPVDRLVDWMDQAVLILLIGDPVSEKLDPRVNRAAHRSASGRPPACSTPPPRTRQPNLAESIGHILRHRQPNARALTPDALAALIRREPAMRRINEWHSSELAAVGKRCATITVSEPDEPATPTGPTFPTDSTGDKPWAA